MSYVSETERIARAAAGDQGAISALVNLHMPRVHALAFRMLRQTEAAEDVTQETFIKAWKALPEWQPKARFSTWLHRVALNLCYDRLRKSSETFLAEPPDQVDTALRPDQALDQRQKVKAIEDAIFALPERQKAALTLCAIEGHSNIEAAEIMDVSVDALESLLSRARRTLKHILSPDLEATR